VIGFFYDYSRERASCLIAVMKSIPSTDDAMGVTSVAGFRSACSCREPRG
jgi:hypothetical protein